MDELMLGMHAVAGELQELFAVEMTTAIGTCARAVVRPSRSERPTSFEAPASCFVARSATTRS